jgi:pimeloyl-ACP methyl ester carboxylesterase
MAFARRFNRAPMMALVLAILLTICPGRVKPAWAAPACPADGSASGGRYVVWVPGFLSSSLTGLQPGTLDPGNHQVRDEAAPVRDALAAGLVPPPRFVYFSYGAVRLAAAGEAPERAWLGDTYFDEHEPRYWPQDTSSYPLQAHADALDWLVRDLLRCDADATIDVIGYSLGGVVALRWAATADVSPTGPLASVHRLVVVDSPVGGVNPAILGSAAAAAPPDVVYALGTGTALANLVPGGDVIRSLPVALGRVDVASIENSRDYIVNGAPLPGQSVLGANGWLGRGAAATMLPPEGSPDAYLADMGTGVALGPTLWDYLVGVHGAVLADPDAHQRLLDLLGSDGPIWQARYGTLTDD